MKRWLLLLASSVLFCSILLRPSACVATSVIGFESYQFSSPKIYQGDSDVYVDLEIINNDDSPLIVHGGLVHFDWQAFNQSFMVGSQRSGEPWDFGKTLTPDERYTIRIDFSVPSSVTEGGHSFFFKVFYEDGLEVQWNPRSQNPYAELTIYHMWERTYNNLITTVENKVVQAWGAGFYSPEAKSLLQRAEDYLDNAYYHADEGQWQSAVSRLQAASTLVDQAYATEQVFRTYLIIGGIVGICAVIGGLFVYRRRVMKKHSESDQ